MKEMSKTFFIAQIFAGLALGILFVLWLAHCSWDRPNPSAFTPVPGNPCGNVGVPCGDANGNFTHMCCDEGETCGGPGRSCPDGECCDVRETPAFLSRSDAGVTHEILHNATQVTVVKAHQKPASP
jgi:hypothetical protein